MHVKQDKYQAKSGRSVKLIYNFHCVCEGDLAKSKETKLWPLHSFAIHAHYGKETNGHMLIIIQLCPRIVPFDTR